jgi:hypothetical protein
MNEQFHNPHFFFICRDCRLLFVSDISLCPECTKGCQVMHDDRPEVGTHLPMVVNSPAGQDLLSRLTPDAPDTPRQNDEGDWGRLRFFGVPADAV